MNTTAGRKISSVILSLFLILSLTGCSGPDSRLSDNNFEQAWGNSWQADNYDSWDEFYDDWQQEYGSWEEYYDSWEEFYDDALEAYEEDYADDSETASEESAESADNTSGSSYEENSYEDLWDDYYEEDGYIIVAADESYDISSLDIPEYTTKEVIEINDGIPFFTEEELCSEFFIQLTELDSLGRAGSAMMCASEENIQNGERGSISSIHPSGWHSNSIYNRSHLLMWKLSGCDDERNLITGTEEFNQESMLEYEYMVTDFLWDNTDMHVMYRVTPLFVDDELVARGVLMEAFSVEDSGEGLCFCVFVYNVEDGYDIDYSDGGYYW